MQQMRSDRQPSLAAAKRQILNRKPDLMHHSAIALTSDGKVSAFNTYCLTREGSREPYFI